MRGTYWTLSRREGCPQEDGVHPGASSPPKRVGCPQEGGVHPGEQPVPRRVGCPHEGVAGGPGHGGCLEHS